jgi:hypothetical protein
VPNPWFRLYSEFSDDPKVQMMPEAMQRRLIMLLCERCKCETLHETERAFHWRITETELAETKTLFIKKGFIDDDWNLLNWDRRQFLSDSSTDRVRKHRQASKQNETLRKQEDDVTVTPPEAETDSKQTRAYKPAPGAGDSALFPVRPHPDGISPEMVADAVLKDLRIRGRDLGVVLVGVCRDEMSAGAAIDDLRSSLVLAWQDYEKSKPKLCVTFGAEKFFGHGMWRNRDGWSWKDGHAPPKKPARVPDAADRQIAEDAARLRQQALQQQATPGIVQ